MRGPRRRRSGWSRNTLADAARTAALEVLRAVRAADAYTNLALPAALKRHGLSGRDAAFATELTSGTVRRQGLYDAVIAACVDRPLAKVQARVLDALRLGTHQLLAMRVPAHAAISTTVALVRSDVGPGAAGFANAVLRKVSEDDLDGWVARVAPDRSADPVGHLSIAHAHPRWVVEALAEAVGEAEVEALLVADNEPPGVTLVARPGRSTRDELPGEPTRWSPYGVHLTSGDPGAVAAVAEGRAGVQDEGSQLVALALAAAPVDGHRSPMAGPLCRARRQGRPARRARRRAGGRPGGQRAAAAPRRARAANASGSRRRAGRGDGRRRPPPVVAGDVRPGAGRRAVHRPRCLAAATRGALAPPALGPGRVGPSPGSAAVVGARLGAARGCRAVRDVLPGTGRDVRGRVGRAGGPARCGPRGRHEPAARRTGLRGPAARYLPALATPARNRCHVRGSAA